MAKETRKRLTAEECRDRADECREEAIMADNPEHRIMLQHMAETWERIADVVAGQKREH
jgi:hypothetical protein